MKTMLLLLVVLTLIAGMVVDRVPELGTLPGIGEFVQWLSDAGMAKVPSAVGEIASDLWRTARDHNLGPLHFAVLVVGVLLVRKVFVWILR